MNYSSNVLNLSTLKKRMRNSVELTIFTKTSL